MKLHYRKIGTGRPLIFLHGLFGSGDNWLSLGAKFSGCEVWLPDLRNHGESPWADEISVPLLAKDLLDFLTEHQLDSVLVGGHSLGAKVAMEATLTEPRRFRGLICLDMAPRAYEPHYSGFVPALQALDLATVTSRSEAQKALEAAIPDRPTLQFLLKSLVPQEGTPSWRWKLNLQALEKHYDEIWKPLQGQTSENLPRLYPGPALFLAGGNSDYVRLQDHALVHQLFPQAEIQTIPQAGHWLHAEKPQEVLSAINTWLSRHP
ncbi:MAG: alpha/beta fold hydrolase [Spirochaetales bacterium]|nr:alpha/beta fold hydrolase [Spirochaetales bacterium]